MKNFIPFIVLSLLISLIAISTYQLSHEQNSKQDQEETNEGKDYNFVKTKKFE